jgi:Domain of unknown function DUF29
MAKALDKSSLYDTDYVAWLDEQARHLRAGRLHALDIENVARELESLMKTERRELRSRLEILILHLLKWDHQPEQRSNRWRATVTEQRRRIRDLLLDSPSLRQEVGPICQAVYQDAVQQAAVETLLSARVFSSDLPYSVEQIFERELPADELPDQRSTRKKPR